MLTLTPASYNIDACWTAPANSGGAAVEAYKIELEDTVSGRTTTQTIRPAALMNAIGNFELTPNTAHRAKVLAVNSIGRGGRAG